MQHRTLTIVLATGLALAACSSSEESASSPIQPSYTDRLAQFDPITDDGRDDIAIGVLEDDYIHDDGYAPIRPELADQGPDTGVALYGDLMHGTLPAEFALDPSDVESENVSQVTYTRVGADFDPDVSPDGELIVFASTQHRPTADIYIRHRNGSALTRLTNDPANDLMPSISPDSKRVAFASNRSGNWDIFVTPITGGAAVSVTSDSAHELHPSWSADGTKLVFCRLGQTSGRWEMWVVETENPSLSHFIGYGLFPEFSPVARAGSEGRERILFQRSRERGSRSYGIWTVDYANGQSANMTHIASSDVEAYINPTWSPDGKRVIYASVPNPDAWGDFSSTRPDNANLWMIGVDEGGLVNLTSGISVDLMPAWAPGNQVYFVSDRGGADNLWVMNVNDAVLASSAPTPTDTT
ncbi:MAG: PD40 domain-containing protein, partial [Phycisphaerales bacterium]|nr:PD40 domain-containing protein [Phycisphaerales bacterium]